MPFTTDNNWYDFRDSEISDPRPALFLDRDGVLIEEHNYIKNPADVALIDGSVRALKPFVLEGYLLIIVSNQSGVGRGLLDWDDVFAVQQRFRELWHADNLSWDMALLCPHHPTKGQGDYLQDNAWRKPHTGMFEFATKTLPIDMSRSIMVGDKLTDLQAAHEFGIPTLIHVKSGHGVTERSRILAKIPDWDRAGDIRLLESIADLTLE